MRTVAFIRERVWENQKMFDYFLVDESVEDVEAAFRSAVEEYLKTPEAKNDLGFVCGDYNWGDAMLTVPTEIFNRHGIYPTSSNVEVVVVDQDEVLFPELQEARFQKEQ